MVKCASSKIHVIWSNNKWVSRLYSILVQTYDCVRIQVVWYVTLLQGQWFLMFQRIMSPSFSRISSPWRTDWIGGLSMLGDEGDTIIWNVMNQWISNTVSHPRSLNSSSTVLWEPQSLQGILSSSVGFLYNAERLWHGFFFVSANTTFSWKSASAGNMEPLFLLQSILLYFIEKSWSPCLQLVSRIHTFWKYFWTCDRAPSEVNTSFFFFNYYYCLILAKIVDYSHQLSVPQQIIFTLIQIRRCRKPLYLTWLLFVKYSTILI